MTFLLTAIEAFNVTCTDSSHGNFRKYLKRKFYPCKAPEKTSKTSQEIIIVFYIYRILLLKNILVKIIQGFYRLFRISYYGMGAFPINIAGVNSSKNK